MNQSQNPRELTSRKNWAQQGSLLVGGCGRGIPTCWLTCPSSPLPPALGDAEAPRGVTMTGGLLQDSPEPRQGAEQALALAP